MSVRAQWEIDDERERFQAWYRKVDAIVSSIAGIGIDDLADGPSFDSFRDGASPREYAEERLADEGFPF